VCQQHRFLRRVKVGPGQAEGAAIGSAAQGRRAGGIAAGHSGFTETITAPAPGRATTPRHRLEPIPLVRSRAPALARSEYPAAR
jgi:hypothetical protein